MTSSSALHTVLGAAIQICGAGHILRSAPCVLAYKIKIYGVWKSTHGADWLTQPVRLLLSYNMEMIVDLPILGEC